MPRNDRNHAAPIGDKASAFVLHVSEKDYDLGIGEEPLEAEDLVADRRSARIELCHLVEADGKAREAADLGALAPFGREKEHLEEVRQAEGGEELHLRVAEAHVDLDDVEDAGYIHQLEIHHAGVVDGIDQCARHLVDLIEIVRRVHAGHRREPTRAAAVRPTGHDLFVVAGRGEDPIGLLASRRDDEVAYFLAREDLFDHHQVACLFEFPADQAASQRALARGFRAADRRPLAAGKAVRFDDDLPVTELAVGECLFHVPERAVGGCLEAQGGHNTFHVSLGLLEHRRRFRWAEDHETLGTRRRLLPEDVDDAVAEWLFRPHDRETDSHGVGPLRQSFVVTGRHRRRNRHLRTRRECHGPHEEPSEARRTRHEFCEGMLSSRAAFVAVTNDQYGDVVHSFPLNVSVCRQPVLYQYHIMKLMSVAKWSAVVVAFLLPQTVLGAVVINEVLFDPAGSDTGLELIELYNDAGTEADISNWQLYPDGIGYYTMPQGTKLAARAFLTVHLRASGTNTAADLYHSAATANMGNSSGSIALFKAGERTKDMIQSFLRYHKPGSTERKTWEPTAAEAGLWQAGSFIDIASYSEGQSLALKQDGIVSGAQNAWQIGAATIGASNAAAAGGSGSATEPTPSAHPEFSTAPSYVIPRLGAEIAVDTYAAVGAEHRFVGRAYGLDKKLMDEGIPLRFLWNFGDGSVAEGPAVTHVFHFPGTYLVSLSVNSGAAIGSAMMTITAGDSGVRISGLTPGGDGFVELTNQSARLIDVTGWILKDAANSFTFPEGTRLAAHARTAFPNEITRLGAGRETTLYFGNMKPVSGFVPMTLPNAGLDTTGARAREPINPPRVEEVSSVVVANTPTTKTAALGNAVPKEASGNGFLWLTLGIGILGGATTIAIRRMTA